MEKQSVQICVFTGSERTQWINPELARFLTVASAVSTRGDRKINITYVMNKTPHDCARNTAVKQFAGNYDWLLMIDNDQAIGITMLDMLDAAPADAAVIVPRNYFLKNTQPPNFETSLVWWSRNGSQPNGEWVELSKAGTGIMAIRKDVFTKIERPAFKFEYDTDGIMSKGEDEYFCEKVRAAGMKVYGNVKHMGRHWHSVEVGTLAMMTGKANTGVNTE